MKYSSYLSELNNLESLKKELQSIEDEVKLNSELKKKRKKN
ncbi:hypothetical protein [Peptoniphilus indolicus]|nr:hypothetical protein [Peptoniphilus indolicus]